MTTETPVKVWTYAGWETGEFQFLKAMDCGQVFECDQEMWDYWLGVLPPVFMNERVKLATGEVRKVTFGSADGDEAVIAWWWEGGRHFGCRTNVNARDVRLAPTIEEARAVLLGAK